MFCQSSKISCEWTCRCHECTEDRRLDNYVFNKDYEKILWQKNNYLAEQQVELDRMPKKHTEDLALCRKVYETEEGCNIREKLAESDKKLAESDKKLMKSEKNLAISNAAYDETVTCKNESIDCLHKNFKELEEKLAESDKKLKTSEDTNADYRMMVKCKNEELDEYNKNERITAKQLAESDKKLAESYRNSSKSDTKYKNELANVRIIATAEVDELLRKKITQFDMKLGCSEANQAAWRLKIADKDLTIESLQMTIKIQGELYTRTRDDLEKAKTMLADKSTEEPMVKKART
jgi:hypothetical protein